MQRVMSGGHHHETPGLGYGATGRPSAGPDDAAALVLLMRCDGPACEQCRAVAGVLRTYGLGTLPLDMPVGDAVGGADVAVQIRCLDDALDVFKRRTDEAHWRRPALGLFGACNAAAAALQVAAARPGDVAALVLLGARVDLAPRLGEVRAPTLLLVGDRDSERLRVNRNALRRLQCKKRLEIVPGATNRFDEPGALDAVAHLSADWFVENVLRRRH
jgi:pimeloyl-ACP methyl ester carboxylesterase